MGLVTLLAVSLLIKIAVFDPNWRFKPGCMGPGGFYILEGTQTDIFREKIASPALAFWMPHGYRVDRQNVYISLIDFDDTNILNLTTKAIRWLEESEMNSLVSIEKYIEIKKARGQFPPRPSDPSVIDCELVAAIAIK